MIQIADAVIERMAQALVAEADPEMVILFGSRARGDFPLTCSCTPSKRRTTS